MQLKIGLIELSHTAIKTARPTISLSLCTQPNFSHQGQWSYVCQPECAIYYFSYWCKK